MSIAAYIVAVFSSLWIDYGWQPLPGGGNEYIIQVPPELIDTLRTDGIESYVPPEVRDIRRIRITVGNQPLARSVSTPESQTAREAPAAGHDVGNSILANSPEEKQAEAPADAKSRTAKYAAEPVTDAETAGGAAVDTSTGIRGWLSSVGVDPMSAAQIGLGIAGAAIVFLVWAQISTRRRYRELLSQSRR